ncbi:MAG: hypothetical protein EBZ48_10105 [Proteobacteria bacterium]|nr:hypothetical protein [Pseudomonadota bacterium]
MPRFLLLSIALTVGSASAADCPALSVGLQMNEVLTRWGEPQRREEQESRRRELWVYQDGVVTFLQGRVIDYPGLIRDANASSGVAGRGGATVGTAHGEQGAQAASHRVAPLPASDEGQAKRGASSEDVIREVLRSMPAGEEGKSGARRAVGGRAPFVRPTPADLLPPMNATDTDESPE